MFTIEDGVITITKGDSGYINFTLTTFDNSPYDMQDGDKLAITVRKKADPSNPILLYAESSSSTMILLPEETAKLDPGYYSYDVQLSTAAGDVFTIIGATEPNKRDLRNFIVVPEVTV